MDRDILTQLWDFLDVDPDVSSLLVEMGVLFLENSMVVDPAYEQNEDLMNMLVTALTGVWRFVQFSESRWLSLVATSRVLVAAELTGISALVAEVMADQACSDYHIKGWSRLGATGLSFCAKAALGGLPAGLLLAELMEDDRINFRLEILQLTVRTGLIYLASLPPAVYHLLANFAGETESEMRLRNPQCSSHIRVLCPLQVFQGLHIASPLLLSWRDC